MSEIDADQCHFVMPFTGYTRALGIQEEPPDCAHVAWPRVGRRMAGRYACPVPSSAWRRWQAGRSCLRVGRGA